MKTTWLIIALILTIMFTHAVDVYFPEYRVVQYGDGGSFWVQQRCFVWWRQKYEHNPRLYWPGYEAVGGYSERSRAVLEIEDLMPDYNIITHTKERRFRYLRINYKGDPQLPEEMRATGSQVYRKFWFDKKESDGPQYEWEGL